MDIVAKKDEPEYYYYDKTMIPIGFGLRNVNAICWCNSVIQFLLGLPSLNKTLLECEIDFTDNVFSQEYVRVLKSILCNSKEYTTENLLTASMAIFEAFKQQAIKKGKKIKMGLAQECVDEAFTLFIDMFDCLRVEQLFKSIYELTVTCTNCKKNVSIIRDPSCRIEMFTNLKLDTKEKFCQHIKLHMSECDFFKCDECGHKMSKFYRVERLKMLREIIVLIFNKFQTKDNRWFPQTLTFKSLKGPELNYVLVGKIEHSGNMNSGHYYANSMRNGKWCRLNDTSVSLGDGNPTPGSFMIAYHLVDNESLKIGV